MNGILVVLELQTNSAQRASRISRISWEALAAGQKFAAAQGQSITAAIVGADTESLASEIAAKGIATTAGVIDAGYRGEILILMTNLGDFALNLKAGEKIAQMIPVPVLTGIIEEVASLEDSNRADKGFGSSGQ